MCMLMSYCDKNTFSVTTTLGLFQEVITVHYMSEIFHSFTENYQAYNSFNSSTNQQ